MKRTFFPIASAMSFAHGEFSCPPLQSIIGADSGTVATMRTVVTPDRRSSQSNQPTTLLENQHGMIDHQGGSLMQLPQPTRFANEAHANRNNPTHCTGASQQVQQGATPNSTVPIATSGNSRINHATHPHDVTIIDLTSDSHVSTGRHQPFPRGVLPADIRAYDSDDTDISNETGIFPGTRFLSYRMRTVFDFQIYYVEVDAQQRRKVVTVIPEPYGGQRTVEVPFELFSPACHDEIYSATHRAQRGCGHIISVDHDGTIHYQVDKVLEYDPSDDTVWIEWSLTDEPLNRQWIKRHDLAYPHSEIENILRDVLNQN